MNELMSFGITARALQILTGSDTLPAEIPSGWFNWQYVQKTDSDNIVVNRLQLLNVEANGSEVETWNKNAINVGYECVLVWSLEDKPEHTCSLPNLHGSTVIHPISHMPCLSELEERGIMLDLYREPESFFQNNWHLVKLGVKWFEDQNVFNNTLPSHWLAYGLGLAKWLTKTAKGMPDSEFRKTCPDYTIWNAMKFLDQNYPNDKLALDLHWNNPQEDVWQWSLDNPCTVADIPALVDHGYVAYYPMRQMPCCGIAIDTEGKLHTIGALPTEPDGSWAFDDGSIRQAFEQKAQELLAMV